MHLVCLLVLATSMRDSMHHFREALLIHLLTSCLCFCFPSLFSLWYRGPLTFISSSPGKAFLEEVLFSNGVIKPFYNSVVFGDAKIGLV